MAAANAVTIAQGMVIAVQAMQAAANLLSQAQKAGEAVKKAQQEGRTYLSDTEWLSISQVSTDSLDALRKTIATAPV